MAGRAQRHRPAAAAASVGVRQQRAEAKAPGIASASAPPKRLPLDAKLMDELLLRLQDYYRRLNSRVFDLAVQVWPPPSAVIAELLPALSGDHAIINGAGGAAMNGAGVPASDASVGGGGGAAAMGEARAQAAL